jgi:hypothetical protein
VPVEIIPKKYWFSGLLGENVFIKGENSLFLDTHLNLHSYIAIFLSPNSEMLLF